MTKAEQEGCPQIWRLVRHADEATLHAVKHGVAGVTGSVSRPIFPGDWDMTVQPPDCSPESSSVILGPAAFCVTVSRVKTDKKITHGCSSRLPICLSSDKSQLWVWQYRRAWQENRFKGSCEWAKT